MLGYSKNPLLNTLINPNHLLARRLEQKLWSRRPSCLEIDNSMDRWCPRMLCTKQVRAVLEGFLGVVEH